LAFAINGILAQNSKKFTTKKAGACPGRLPLLGQMEVKLLALPGLLGFGFASASVAGRRDGSEFLHDAALTTGSIVFVDHAFFGGLIQVAYSLSNRCLRIVTAASLNSGHRVLHRSAGSAAKDAVADAAFFVLAISLNRRYFVCQLNPPE
jgi:hypothetical protein